MQSKRRRKYVLLLTFLAAACILAKPIVKQLYPHKYSGYVLSCGEMYGVPSELLYAVICCESGFRHDAVSSAGACGLMQLTEPTFREICGILELSDDSDIFSPQINIRCGTYYLRYLYDRYGNWETALAAYNAGLGTVDGWLSDSAYSKDGRTLSNIPYKETKNHVKKVMRAWNRYQKIYKES